MSWGGQEEWRDRWASAPSHLRRRVGRGVREGRRMDNPAEAALAVGLALQLLHRHRWLLLAVPWFGGLVAVSAMAFVGSDPTVTWAVAGGATAGTWLHRLLLAGPRLRRAYDVNRAVTAGHSLRRAVARR